MTGGSMKVMVTILAGVLGVSGARADDSSAPGAQLVWSDDQNVFQRGDCRSATVADIAQTFGLSVDESPKTTRRLRVSSEPRKYADLANYVIEILKNKGRFPNSNLPLRGSFWQVAMEEDGILAAMCGSPEKPYLLFDVFVPNKAEPLARVGVSAAEIGLFEKIEIHSPNEAELAIDKAGDAGRVFVKAADHRSNRSQAPDGNAGSTPGSAARPAPESKLQPGSPLNPKAPAPTAAPKRTDAPKATTTKSDKQLDDAPSKLATKPDDDEDSPVKVVTGLGEVVCTGVSSVAVLAGDLATEVFSAHPLETVRPVQSFGVDKQVRTKNGRKVTYVKVQFPDRGGDENVGWLDSAIVRSKSNCSAAPTSLKTDLQTPKASKGLSNDCCRFPMVARTTQSYREGMRRFRAGRSRGRRLHAACDLYRPQGERVVAIAPGQVIRDRYYFYQGVYALEVRHGNGYVVRYGEILGRSASGAGAGSRVAPGQTIGFVGWIGNPNISPMLHFELFSGRGNGPLTQRDRGGFQRRSDLLDPTNYLVHWEQSQFGQHW